MECPDPESLILETEEVLRHLSVCAACRADWLALKRSERVAAPTRSWMWKAAAAVLLLGGLAVWRTPKGPAPAPARIQAADATWVAPGLRVQGPAKRIAASRWRLDAGEVRIEDRLGGGIELEVPSGSLKGLEPWAGRVRVGTPRKLSWITEALADATELLVEVDEGRVEVRQGEETLILSAGERLRGSVREAFVPSPSNERRVWKPGILDGGTAGMPFALPLAGLTGYAVEVKVRLLSPQSRVGLAVPVGGGLRLWQASGEPKCLALAVLGKAASGSADGVRLWTLDDAAQDLQAAEGEPGLRVWGKVEVLEVVVRAP